MRKQVPGKRSARRGQGRGVATWTLAQAGAGQACHRAWQRETKGSALRVSYTKTVYLLQVEEIQPLSGKVSETTFWGASLLCTRCRAGTGIGWARLAYRTNPLQLSVPFCQQPHLFGGCKPAFQPPAARKGSRAVVYWVCGPSEVVSRQDRRQGRVEVWAIGPCRREAHEGLPVWAPQATESRREPGGM